MPSERSYEDRWQKSTTMKADIANMLPTYTPADAKNSLASFGTVIDEAEAANLLVSTLRIPYADKVADREALAKTIGPLVTQSLAYVTSNSAWKSRHEAIKKAADKVRGVRPKKKKPVDPDPDAKTRDAGGKSYVEIAAYFSTYIARLSGLAGYAPPDAAIDLETLGSIHTLLDGMNKAVPVLEAPLADAIWKRREKYTGEDGLKDKFDGCKASVKGQYGQASAQYAIIKGIRW